MAEKPRYEYALQERMVGAKAWYTIYEDTNIARVREQARDGMLRDRIRGGLNARIVLVKKTIARVIPISGGPKEGRRCCQKRR